MDVLEILILAFASLLILLFLIDVVPQFVADMHSRWRSATLRSKFFAVLVVGILTMSAVGGIGVISKEIQGSRSSFVVPVNSGPNLLMNPGFEMGLAGLANNWHKEYDTESVFSLVNLGVVDGKYAQHISRTGTNKDNNALSEIYQTAGSNDSYRSGDELTFSVYVSGSISKCSMIIGIEGFDASRQWISENDVYLSGLTDASQIFGVSYRVPANCSYVGAFIQFNEIISVSSLSVAIDNASLVRTLAP
jgi:hypothetical protein